MYTYRISITSDIADINGKPAAEASLWVGVDFLTWHDYYDTEEEAQVAVDKLNLRCNREWMEKHGELLPVAHPHFYVSSLPF